MIPIANRPMLFYGLDFLVKADIKEIGVILGPVKEGVKDALGDGSKWGVRITYIDQPNPMGLAHAVLVAEEFLKDDPFIMYLGDNLLRQGVTPLVNNYIKNRTDCVVCVTPVRNPNQ